MNAGFRRQLGFFIGLLMGLAYALVSNLVNRLYLPGIPIYIPWPGTTMLIVASSLMTAVLGLIVAWGDESPPGIIISMLVGSILSSVWAWWGSNANPTVFTLLFLVFLPRCFFYLPLGLAVSWSISRWKRSMDPLKVNYYRRFSAPLVCITLSAFLGFFSLYPQEVRTALESTNQMIQQGMQVTTRERLPQPLQSLWGFVQYGRGEYTVELSRNPDQYPLPRGVSSLDAIESVVIVRFSNGYRFGCIFTPPKMIPVCGEISP